MDLQLGQKKAYYFTFRIITQVRLSQVDEKYNCATYVTLNTFLIKLLQHTILGLPTFKKRINPIFPLASSGLMKSIFFCSFSMP